ncbi:DMT family transporter [Novosphingobium sp. KCTC 2891]|uniref:DMT family transporter n=1 Tax=Novosphingobium sp. KCTC 2891 TaxID=2989730 RepID=UPI0022230115|nr:DMT family transporter [Novosphingobium sp. KCTC 2891]MCW1382287.1 DMT family transporter [Novosphingobium sp. KCTC 2891]
MSSTRAHGGALSHPLPRHYAALLVGNVALALGPWSVRLADTGPVASGFWRLFLALPLLAVLAVRNRQPLTGFGKGAWAAVAVAGVLFALDLASWHIGIAATRLANASLFGNAGSLILMAWGVIAAHRRPRLAELAAVAAALAGAAILLGRSLEIDHATLVGDLFCILAGFFYAFYILLLQRARDRFGSWSLLFHASLTGAPVLLGLALFLGETVWPHNWWPLVALTLGSQIVGQGLLVYALRHFPPLLIGLALLTQPAVAVLAGWFAFGESVGWIDGFGMVLVAAALVLARLGEGPKR